MSRSWFLGDESRLMTTKVGGWVGDTERFPCPRSCCTVRPSVFRDSASALLLLIGFYDTLNQPMMKKKGGKPSSGASSPSTSTFPVTVLPPPRSASALPPSLPVVLSPASSSIAVALPPPKSEPDCEVCGKRAMSSCSGCGLRLHPLLLSALCSRGCLLPDA